MRFEQTVAYGLFKAAKASSPEADAASTPNRLGMKPRELCIALRLEETVPAQTCTV